MVCCRRLCILKGIHPREPKKKVQGQNKTYYHVKDINFLAHEPLLAKFRELSAYDRKVKRAYAKQNEALAKRLLALKPQYRIDHLVRERCDSACARLHLLMLPAVSWGHFAL